MISSIEIISKTSKMIFI